MNLFEFAVKLLSSFKDFNDALVDLEYVRKLELEIRDHGAPQSPHDGGYEQLVGVFRRAADDAIHAPLATAFDAAQFAVSANELTSCATRPAALAKIEGYLNALVLAQSRGSDALATLDAKLVDADTAQQCLEDVIALDAELAQLPDLGQVFTWNWADLELIVRPALADWKNAIKAQRGPLVDQLGKLALYIPNLSANLDTLRRLRCSIDGTWHGSFTIAGETVNDVRVDFAGSGSGYVGAVSGTFDGDAETSTLTNIRIGADRKIHFEVDDFDVVCNGIVSGDFRQMSGTIQDTDDGTAGSFSLQFG